MGPRVQSKHTLLVFMTPEKPSLKNLMTYTEKYSPIEALVLSPCSGTGGLYVGYAIVPARYGNHSQLSLAKRLGLSYPDLINILPEHTQNRVRWHSIHLITSTWNLAEIRKRIYFSHNVVKTKVSNREDPRDSLASEIQIRGLDARLAVTDCHPNLIRRILLGYSGQARRVVLYALQKIFSKVV